MCAKSPHFSHFECTNLCKFADFAPCPDNITYATLPQPTEIMTENMARNTKKTAHPCLPNKRYFLNLHTVRLRHAYSQPCSHLETISRTGRYTYLYI